MMYLFWQDAAQVKKNIIEQVNVSVNNKESFQLIEAAPYACHKTCHAVLSCKVY